MATHATTRDTGQVGNVQRFSGRPCSVSFGFPRCQPRPADQPLDVAATNPTVSTTTPTAPNTSPV